MRAILSVTNKNGIIELAQDLTDLKVEMFSTGGTARAIREAGIPVTEVSKYTGSPEVMDGRVKTLHPMVFGGILSRGTKDLADLEVLHAVEFDLVVVNLYEFAKTAAKEGVKIEEVIENIDIGGPSLIRAAAKNHDRVTILTDPAD